MQERSPQHKRKLLISSPKCTINFVNTMPKRISKYQVVAQLGIGHVRKDMVTSKRAQRQDSLHKATPYQQATNAGLQPDGAESPNTWCITMERPYTRQGSSARQYLQACHNNTDIVSVQKEEDTLKFSGKKYCKYCVSKVQLTCHL